MTHDVSDSGAEPWNERKGGVERKGMWGIVDAGGLETGQCAHLQNIQKHRVTLHDAVSLC